MGLADEIQAENKHIKRSQIAFIGLLCLLGLVAIVYPLFCRLKSTQQAGIAAQNLKLTGQALLIYSEDWGGFSTGLPSGSAAVALLQPKPTCDPQDFWKFGCSAKRQLPMIGSFAYVRGTEYFSEANHWKAYLASTPVPTLLIDLFESHERIGEFKGDTSPEMIERLPEDMLRFQADGSVTSHSMKLKSTWFQFNWPTAFWASEGAKPVPAEVVSLPPPSYMPPAPTKPKAKAKKKPKA